MNIAPSAPPIHIVEEITSPFAIAEPACQIAACVVGVPHAGRMYPQRFLRESRLSPHALRRSEDAFMDLIAGDAPDLGAPLLVAQFPRSFLDVNREPYELDPRMFEGKLPAFVNARSLRVAAGLGAIPRVVGDGHDIYARKLPVSEAVNRIEALHKPYHAAMRDLVTRTRLRFGACVLVDMHSMPSAGLEREGPSRPDVVIGDRFGASASAPVIASAERALRRAGFSVSRNKPYAGGHITEHYGQPAAGLHALQIELNRALYMNEAAIEPNAGFAAVRAAMAESLALMFEAWGADLLPMRLAAE